MEKRLPYRLLYRSQETRRDNNWIISYPNEDGTYTEVHCKKSPLIADNIAATIEYSNGVLFDFDGELPANHSVNLLKETSLQQKILDNGYIIPTNGQIPTHLAISGTILQGEFEVSADGSNIVSIKRVDEVNLGLPIHVPQKTPVRFEVNIDDFDFTETIAWAAEQQSDIFVEPKLVGLRAIVSKDAIHLEGSDVNQIERFPDFAEALATLSDSNDANIVLDGELVQSTLYVFSVLEMNSQDVRGESEEARIEMLENLNLSESDKLQPMPYVRVGKDAKKTEWKTALQKAFDMEASEGAVLKDALSTSDQKWNSDWAKVKLVRYYVAKILSKTPVDDPERTTWVYELGFKNEYGKIVSLGTSMATGIVLNPGNFAVIALPISDVWETPIVKTKSDRKTPDKFVPKSRFDESGTPLWVECEEMEAELASGVLCNRLGDIVTRSWEIYANAWVYSGERDYAKSIWDIASQQQTGCQAQIRLDVENIDFGDIELGDTGEQQVRTFNNADYEGEILECNLTPDSSGYFSASEEAFSVPPQEAHVNTIYFNPSATGYIDGTIKIQSNDSRNPILWYYCNAMVGGGVPRIGWEWGTYWFGEVALNDYGEVDQIITNDGDGDLELSNMHMEDVDDAAFRIIGDDSNVTLSPGDGYSITLGFFPPRVGVYSSMFWIDTNDPEWPVIRFQLGGQGV